MFSVSSPDQTEVVFFWDAADEHWQETTLGAIRQRMQPGEVLEVNGRAVQVRGVNGKYRGWGEVIA